MQGALNRGRDDLLAIIDLLGGDNFDDDVLEIVERIWKRRGDPRETMSDQEWTVLRQAIGRFTLRRTKTMLNALINEAPDRFTNRLGQPCRYPRHRARTYPCDEPDRDCARADAIRAAAGRLRGLINLRTPLRLSAMQRARRWSDEYYLAQRLDAARHLASYQVMDALRSSQAALLEHIHGTATALQEHQLSLAGKEATGNVVETLAAMAGSPPENGLAIPTPEWLSDPTAHAAACEEEIETYRAIADLARGMSMARERAKASLLDRLLARHDLVLAFDRHLMTLAQIARLLTIEYGRDAIVAIGTDQGERKRVNHLFGLGSSAKGLVTLCSDAMAEGINLQAASAIVHLDMPTVIRVAEQRIGRIDRMDSPHQVIEAWWPSDHPAFAVRRRELLVERLAFSARLFGSNLPLPEDLAVPAEDGDTPVRADELIWHLEQGEAESARDDLQDAFAPVRALVGGEAPLVPAAVYDAMKRSTARVVSSVSVVDAVETWAFFAIAGTDRGAPRWVFFDNPQGRPETALQRIEALLRERLADNPAPHPLDAPAAAVLQEFIAQLKRTEIDLLPRKKQRALQEMKRVLQRYRQQAQKVGDAMREETLRVLLSLTTEHQQDRAVDLGMVADCWIGLVRPVWYRCLQQRPRGRPMLLADIRPALLSEPLDTDHLREAFKAPLWIQTVDERIVAAIIGVPPAT